MRSRAEVAFEGADGETMVGILGFGTVRSCRDIKALHNREG